MTKEGAQRMAHRIEQFWRRRGFDSVKVWSEFASDERDGALYV